MTISFFVPGIPRPQGSKRAINHRTTGRPIVIESGGRPLVDWRGDIKREAIEAMGDDTPLDGPVGIWLGFRLPRPKSHPKTKITYPISRPDIDKLTRAVLDALTAVCYRDDAQITELLVFKEWAVDQPGVRVKVANLAGVHGRLLGVEPLEEALA